jgi:hypothetical protein
MSHTIRKSLIAMAFFALAAPASAAYVVATASCPGGGTAAGCDPTVTDNYGFEFKIESTAQADIFKATLTNTSSTSLSGALIDLLAFNMNPSLTLGTDFSILNVMPDWTFSAGSGGVKFDYVGDADTPGDKIGPNQTLTFDLDFDVALPADPFTLWTTADKSAGTGIGGGGDTGQVAVSFQQLGKKGQDSDLLVANWTYNNGGGGGGGGNVPEPASLALVGIGLMAFGMARRRKRIVA